MQITSTRFIISSTKVDQCPKANLAEYAFVGRSNVGKSSLINMIAGEKNLAKTSGTPGKTQLINHFMMNEGWYLADLPGYGYAKISREKREKWGKMITSYLLQRTNLLNTFVLIDSRLAPQKIDLDFMEWMGINNIPFVIVFTKSDKLNAREIVKNTEEYYKVLLETWEELPPVIISSAQTKKGKEEILSFIEQTNMLFVADSDKLHSK
jgi:GTP-binding protein